MEQLHLHVTYSAFREMETIPSSTLKKVSEAINALPTDPYPRGSSLLKGIGACYYLGIEDYYILYHATEDKLTIFGVLHGVYHPLH